MLAEKFLLPSCNGQRGEMREPGTAESHVNVNCGPLGVTMSIIKFCHPATDTSITQQGPDLLADTTANQPLIGRPGRPIR